RARRSTADWPVSDPNAEAAPPREALAWTAVTLLFTAASLLYFWPLLRHFGDHIGPDLGDPLFNLWVLKWGAHEIRLGLPNLWNGNVWNANIFYPTKGTLAFSDHLLGPAAELVLFLEVFPNAIAGYNFLFLSSFVGSALAVCWMLRKSGLSWPAAVLAGWMYSFSSFRLSQMSHLQILIAQWIPLALWFWDRLLTERTAKNAALFLLFYLLNLSGGCYLAYMIHFSLLAIFLSRAPTVGRDLFSLRSLRVLIPVAGVAALAVAAFFLPYVRISRTQGLSRPKAEIEFYSAKLASYFSPSPENGYFGDEANRLLHQALGDSADRFFRPENSLFAGFLPTILFFAGAWAAWRERRKDPADPWVRGLVLSGVFCFILSFAWAFLPLARIVPGLSGMRVPARFYAFVSLTVVYFAARGVDFLRRRVQRPRARAALLAGLAAALLIELAPWGFRTERLPREGELPQVYRWLRDELSVQGLVELPLYGDSRENDYLYASTVHWKPIANGYSGYMAPSFDALANQIFRLPGVAGFDLLRKLKISHIVVHAQPPLRIKEVRRWERRHGEGPEREMEKVYGSEDDGIFVYRVLAAPAQDGP
ncbi:MAG TPA: hypothetical protein VLX28_24860, partial [Thermoanaerobaculia bacterium]|nr:hypothetical protein [Thermoanaerobaculia bacterium]